MKFLDLFAGIGGFRLALERQGHECVGFCEIDKYARQTYKANFDTKGEVEWHDITTVTTESIREIGYVDIITGGFPCQAFSVAGKRGGFEDTRGTLFFEIARIAKQVKPRFLLLENVKGLLSHDKGETFGTILTTLDELGYDAEWQVINSKDHGVPQNRERVFIVGHSRRFPRREVFPIEGENGNSIKQLGNLDQHKRNRNNPHTGRVYGVNGLSPTLTTCGGGNLEPKIVTPVLTPDRAEKRQNGRRFKEPGEPMFTLTAQDRHGVLEGYRIRKLSPLECFRLQGFPDSHHDNAKAAGVSNSQLYKQAGNSVTVPVVEEIVKRLYQ